MKAVKLLVVAALIGAGTPGHGQEDGEKITFDQWSVPGIYEMTIETVDDQEMTVNGQVRPKQRREQMLVMEVTVAPPDPAGERTVTVAFRRLKQVAKKGRQTLSYDSADPKANRDTDLSQAYEPMLKIQLRIVVGPKGEVREVSGFEGFWEELARKDPKSAAMLRDMQKKMGDSVVRELMVKGRQLVPAGGVSLGQAWRSQVKMTAPFIGETDLVQDCKLTDVRQTQAGRIAQVDYKGKMIAPAGATATVGDVSLKFSRFDMDQTGQIRFNLDTGILAGSNLQRQLTMEMSGKNRKGQHVTMVLKQRGTAKLSVRKLAKSARTQPAAPPAK
ncbi:MAG: DUF6263 family protein [Planctomycetota bacterium]|jgi:hypothetical protein